jgi:hypothetical protein
MMSQFFLRSDVFSWTSGLALLVGCVVASVVYVSLKRYMPRWLRLAPSGAMGSELPPADLLAALSARLHSRGGHHALADMPATITIPHRFQSATTLAEPQEGDRIRWGNPTEVQLSSSLTPTPVRGLVYNQSSARLGVLVDQAVSPGSVWQLRAIEAPDYIPSVDAEVKSCQRAAKSYALVCQFRSQVPWNVRVWFG